MHNKLKSASAEESERFFWHKKVIVSYFLSIFILFVHLSTFSNYKDSGTLISGINNFAEILICNSFSRCAVAFFFILSGALFFKNYDSSMFFAKLRSRFRSLFIPFVIWNFIWMLFEIICSYSFISDYYSGREKFVLSLSNVFLAVFHYKCYLPFWFIFELLFFVLITPLIHLITSKKYFAFSCIIILEILSYFEIGLPYPLFFSQSALVYYLIGCTVGKFYFHKFTQKSDKKTQLTAGIVFLLCTGAFVAESYCGLDVERQPGNTVLFLLCSWSLWVLADVFVDKIRKTKIFGTSFMMYALHLNISSSVTKLIYLASPNNEYLAIPNAFITVSVTVLLVTMFSYALQRISPKLYSILTGNR